MPWLLLDGSWGGRLKSYLGVYEQGRPYENFLLIHRPSACHSRTLLLLHVFGAFIRSLVTVYGAFGKVRT